MIWLLRHLKPDFKTIADFRRDNRKAFRLVFREFVLLCRQLKLFGRELLAVDGTRIKGVNNKDRNFTRASLAEFIRLADAKLDDYLRRLDTGDAAKRLAGGSRVKNLAEKIPRSEIAAARCQGDLRGAPRQQSHGGAHARCSRLQRAGCGGGYQAQADRRAAGHQPGPRYVLLTETAKPAKQILDVEQIAVVADRGYFKIEDIEACKKAGMEPYVPRPQRGPSVRAGLFRKDEFGYDPETDTVICPVARPDVPRRRS